MADNTVINTGTGGDSIRDKDRTGIKTQIVALDLNPASASESLMAGTMPVSDSLGQGINSSGSGFLKVSDEPVQIFYDSFDAAPDTTNMWTITSGNSGVAATVTTGVLSMGTGTVANGWSKVASIPIFKPTIPGWLVFSDAIAFPDGAAPIANSYRFWGNGTTPATPSVATPVTDGYGFELYTDGKLRTVVYAGGTRTIIADLSAGTGTGTQPLNASYHRWIIQVRTDKTFFYIDSIASSGLVATTSFQSSQAQILPKLFLCIGNSTPPVSNTQLQCTGAVVSDTGKNAVQVADATYPWRKLLINSTGAASTIEAAPTTVLNGKTSVTTAGTRVVLASSTTCKSVTIKALSTNTGFIYVGSSTVSSANGFQLSAGDTISIDIANLNTVNIDSSVNGESVTYIAIN